MDIYKKNLDALAKVDPQLEKLLQFTTTNEDFEVYLAEEANVDEANIMDKRYSSYMYKQNSLVEINTKLKQFQEYDNHPILYFFGIGNGSFFKELLKNQKHQELLVLEPEIQLIYIALNLVDLSQEISESRLVIKLTVLIDRQYFVKDLSEMKKFFVKAYNLHIYSNFYDRYMVEINRVNKDIVEAFKYSMYIVGNSAKDSLIGLEYSLKNIPKMIQSPPLRRYLTSKAKNTKTAIIVSTGPSLSKQLELLKEVREHVTILCVDASFPILAQEGIKPDIVFSIERVSYTGLFYKNTPKEFHKDVIFSLATVCHDETIENIYGQKCFFMRADSYNVFFGLDKWGYMGGGQSAANFAYDFAVKSEFETIVFIGQDLAYGKDGRSHSKNHIFGEDEVKSDRVIDRVTAYGGEGKIETTKVWIAFLNSFITQIENSKVLSINATEGGARINGTLELPFKEVIEKYVDKNLIKKQIVVKNQSQELIDEDLKHFRDKVAEALTIGKNMRKSSEKLYIKIDTFIKKIGEDVDVESISMKKVASLIQGITQIKERYNHQKFTSVFGTLLMGYVINHEYEVAQVYMMRENTHEAKVLKHVEWLKVHHEWLYRVSINLDEILKLLDLACDKDIPSL